MTRTDMTGRFPLEPDGTFTFACGCRLTGQTHEYVSKCGEHRSWHPTGTGSVWESCVEDAKWERDEEPPEDGQ